MTAPCGPGTLGGMELVWFELSQDDRGRFVASCPAKGVSAIGHTAAVAEERLRYAIGGDARFTGELKEGREPKPKAQSFSSESETKDLKPSKQKRDRD